MADLAENLRAFLLDKATITTFVGADGVHQGLVPQDVTLPYIWFKRSARRYLETTDAAPGADPDEERFDLECISDDLDESQDLSQAVCDALNAYRGTFGDTTISGAFVDDQDDDYVPRGTLGETELHTAALAVQIIL